MKRPTPADVVEGRAPWTIVRDDCTRVLGQLTDRTIAVTLTDPPYSQAIYEKARAGTGIFREREVTCALAAGIGEIESILPAVAAHLLRLTARWVVVFHDCELGDRWRAAFGDRYVRTGAWVKKDPMPQFSGDRPAQGFEPMTIAHGAGRLWWNGGGRAGVWTHGTAKGHDRPDHPCPKPLPLMLDLVRDFTDPGDLVLDPFAGSGTTGVACLQLGRRFIGIERDARFAKLARERLALTELNSPAMTLPVREQREIFCA